MVDGEFPRDSVAECKSTRRNGAEHSNTGGDDARRTSETASSAERVQMPFLHEQLARHKVDLRRYESFSPELVRFAAPPGLSPDHAQLVVNIVVLDHRSLHAFGARSSARAEVKALLQNAVITAGHQLVDSQSSSARCELGEVLPAIGLYRQAEEIFLRHLQARNRLRYLMGVALGILFLVAVSFAVQAGILPDGLDYAIPPRLLPTIIFFSGLGSIVSVLLRLSDLDVVKEISRSVLLISGTGRPLVASAFALVIYSAISSGLVAVSIGAGSEIGAGASIGAGNQIGGAYLVVAFLCGFSERFAKDLLERVERTRESQRRE